MTERWLIDDCGTLIDKETRNTYDYVLEVCPVLNEQEKIIKRVKEYIDKEIKQREEDLKRTIKVGMPTGSLYSEIELFEELQKIINGDDDD